MADETQLLVQLERAATPEDLRKALDALTVAGVESAEPNARMLLRSPHDEVRAAAANYLGYTATGRALNDLAPVVEADPVEMVRTAARHATERILGERDRSRPVAWAPSDESTPPSDLTAARKAAVAKERTTVRAAPAAPAPASAGPTRPSSRVSMARSAPARAPAPPRPRRPSKVEKAILVLGRTDDPKKHEKALTLLRGAPPSEVDAALDARAASPEQVLGQLRAVVGLGRADRMSLVRAALSAPETPTRLAAVEAMAALAGADQLPSLAGLLRDGVSEVRVAAVRAIVVVAKRTDGHGLARTWLTPVRYGPDKVAAKAAEEALVDLAS